MTSSMMFDEISLKIVQQEAREIVSRTKVSNSTTIRYLAQTGGAKEMNKWVLPELSDIQKLG